MNRLTPPLAVLFFLMCSVPFDSPPPPGSAFFLLTQTLSASDFSIPRHIISEGYPFRPFFICFSLDYLVTCLVRVGGSIVPASSYFVPDVRPPSMEWGKIATRTPSVPPYTASPNVFYMDYPGRPGRFFPSWLFPGEFRDFLYVRDVFHFDFLFHRPPPLFSLSSLFSALLRP